MSQASPTAPAPPFASAAPLQSPRSAKRPRPADLHTPAQNNAAVAPGGAGGNVTPLTAAANPPGVDDPFQHEPGNDDDDDADDDDDDAPRKPSDKKSGRRKIKIEYIQDKSRRHITFSKRKAGIMKKAYELSTLTGTQVLLLVVSETGLVYTFTTAKLQPLVTQPEGKNLIQACLNAPNGAPPPAAGSGPGGSDDSPTHARNQPGGISLGGPGDSQQSANSVLGGQGNAPDLDLMTGGPLDSPPLPGGDDPVRPTKVSRKRAGTDVSNNNNAGSNSVDTKQTSSPRSPSMVRPGTGSTQPGGGQGNAYIYPPPYQSGSQGSQAPPSSANSQSSPSAPAPAAISLSSSMSPFSYPSPTAMYSQYGLGGPGGGMGVYGPPPTQQQQQQQQQGQQGQQGGQQRQGSQTGARAGQGSLSNWNQTSSRR